jgi:hypothetical protein
MQRDIVAELSGRPAPQETHSGRGRLAFFLFAAPTAWFVQTVANYGAISYACQGPSPLDPLAGGNSAALWWSVLAVNVVSVLLGAAAIGVAASAWRRQRNGGLGLAARLVEAGEGQGRFLASWGIAGSACFVVGILFSTIALAIVPLCAS